MMSSFFRVLFIAVYTGKRYISFYIFLMYQFVGVFTNKRALMYSVRQSYLLPLVLEPDLFWFCTPNVKQFRAFRPKINWFETRKVGSQRETKKIGRFSLKLMKTQAGSLDSTKVP